MPVLRLYPDHRHVLICAKIGVKHLRDGDVTQFKLLKCGAVISHVHHLSALSAQRGPSPKVDAKIQTLRQE